MQRRNHLTCVSLVGLRHAGVRDGDEVEVREVEIVGDEDADMVLVYSSGNRQDVTE